MDRLKSVGAALLLVLFAAAWTYVGVRLIAYAPTPQFPALDLPEAQVTVAGLLATAVGAGTASVLGIEVAKQQNTQTVAVQASGAVSQNPLLGIGVVIYAAVGCFILGVYWFTSEKTPDFIAAFALGFLGWLAATFTAVYRGAASPGGAPLVEDRGEAGAARETPPAPAHSTPPSGGAGNASGAATLVGAGAPTVSTKNGARDDDPEEPGEA
ncbi:hypothetical protein ACR9E3_29700 [Actinomycetospora sp. C-140]